MVRISFSQGNPSSNFTPLGLSSYYKHNKIADFDVILLIVHCLSFVVYEEVKIIQFFFFFFFFFNFKGVLCFFFSFFWEFFFKRFFWGGRWEKSKKKKKPKKKKIEK